MHPSHVAAMQYCGLGFLSKLWLLFLLIEYPKINIARVIRWLFYSAPQDQSITGCSKSERHKAKPCVLGNERHYVYLLDSDNAASVFNIANLSRIVWSALEIYFHNSVVRFACKIVYPKCV